MNILDKARRLEFRIAHRFDKAARELAGPRETEPLEIVHAILEMIEKEIRPSDRGGRLFPFDRITVMLAAATDTAHAQWQPIVSGKPSLEERIVGRLRSTGCATTGLQITIAFAPQPQAHWRTREFNLELDRSADAGQTSPTEAEPPQLELTVLKGATEQPTFSIAARRVHFGRGVEVRDARNRLVRTNQVVFTDEAGDVNSTVSRQHAHLSYDPATAQYRLFDDGSGHGSGIVRDGRTIAVPSGTRGVRLQSGDEIVLGEALVRVEFDGQ